MLSLNKLTGMRSNFSPKLAAGGMVRVGRIKPDVVAPGSVIYGARSRPKPPANSPEYETFSGTSMAAPLVAGCCASIREAISKMKALFAEPSAAFVKALVINGTVDCQGLAAARNGRAIPPPPDEIQICLHEVHSFLSVPD